MARVVWSVRRAGRVRRGLGRTHRWCLAWRTTGQHGMRASSFWYYPTKREALEEAWALVNGEAL